MSREMKDSGIEWIGKIPETWNVQRIKFITSNMGSGTTPSSDKQEYYDGDIAWIQSGDLYNTPIVTDTAKKVTSIALKSCSALKIYKKPYLVLAMYGASVGNISKSEIDACTNQACCIIKPNKNNDINYLMYWLDTCKDDFIHKSVGGGQPNISQDKVREQNYLQLPLSEQHQIVSFLDRKCSAIDTAIEKTKKSIEKLEEYKKAVITKTVTKGLDPDAKMKDSGIEWIGDVPEEWNFVKLTFITDAKHPYPIGDGDHGLIKNDRYVEEGVPYIRVQNLGWGDELSLKNTVCITEEDNARIINSELHPGDVLFAKTGATIGKVSLVPQTISRANTTSHVGKITLCNKYLPKYILYVLSSTVAYRQLWEIAGRKATRPELSIDEIKDMRLLLTLSLKEQNEIVSYLDNKCSAIDNLITKKNETINKWEEYKKSLIYYAVTGKIDCRNEKL